MVKHQPTDVEPVQEELFDEFDTTASSFKSFSDAANYFKAHEDIVDVGDVAGDGYELIRDKDMLVNIPFLITDWREVTDVESGRDYATIRLITSDDRRYRINDGSTGIYKQLRQIRDEHGITRGIGVAKGLTKSEFFVSQDPANFGKVVKSTYEGKKSTAATYFLSTSS